MNYRITFDPKTPTDNSQLPKNKDDKDEHKFEEDDDEEADIDDVVDVSNRQVNMQEVMNLIRDNNW